MNKKIAINGFGRIGRLAFRKLQNMPGVEVVAINDLTDNATLAHLLKYDTAHGIFDFKIEHTPNSISVDGRRIAAYSEKDPAKLPWKDLGIDVVLECTGIFTSRAGVQPHLNAGAKRVIISAPVKGRDVKTIVIGVNDDELSPEETIYSNASCTTNCLAPIVKVIDQAYEIISGSMTTVHAYTQDQRLQDAPHSDLRRARAAACNIVPTTTGAAKTVSQVYPNVSDKITAMSYRVPIITGSIVDLTVRTKKEAASVEEVNEVIKRAANGESMKHVLYYNEDPIVSSDIVGNPYSSIFDAELTSITDGLIRVVSWYDNEAGYATRLAELAVMVANLGEVKVKSSAEMAV
ncbi:MAG: type I glyceraldehyde-3-phosphate dehydrogenase [Saprospiraceae bacterium]|nr:type I glyceraldehyde-3-phosphate dehydrogenase [Saprospiraceae bacterium]